MLCCDTMLPVGRRLRSRGTIENPGLIGDNPIENPPIADAPGESGCWNGGDR